MRSKTAEGRVKPIAGMHQEKCCNQFMLHGSVYNHHLNGFKNKLAGKVGSRILESTIDGECTFHALLRTVKPKSNT